jgi:hypothetical protein
VDGGAELAPRIWSDLEEIDAWWRSQDAARTPHFDLTRFTCGLQVDLTVRRLSFDTAALRPSAARWDRIRDDLFGVLRVDGTWNKYLLYYDGPTDDPERCGDGGGGVSGTGLGVVYLGACEGQATAAVAAHELLHALGALFRVTAPNRCPGDPGHVCDSPSDLLYPVAQTLPLTARVLDFGRDDYYRHRQPWFGVQESRWLRHLDTRALIRLRLAGRGSVVSDVPGLDCATSCTTSWNPRTAMILVARPAAGQRFVRWEGNACAGSFPRCDVLLDGTESIGAVFAPLRYALSVGVAGRGAIVRGRVACVASCRHEVESHRPVTLRARPAPTWRLRGWSGACGARS